jgi:hypothetical protein
MNRNVARVLKIIVNGPGKPDEIIELRIDEPNGGRRRTLRQNAT